MRGIPAAFSDNLIPALAGHYSYRKYISLICQNMVGMLVYNAHVQNSFRSRYCRCIFNDPGS
jgi:hypothetical protein